MKKYVKGLNANADLKGIYDPSKASKYSAEGSLSGTVATSLTAAIGVGIPEFILLSLSATGTSSMKAKGTVSANASGVQLTPSFTIDPLSIQLALTGELEVGPFNYEERIWNPAPFHVGSGYSSPANPITIYTF